jgi:hypothetical protein
VSPAYLPVAAWVFGGGVLVIILVASLLTKPLPRTFTAEGELLAYASRRLKLAGLCAVFFCSLLYTSTKFELLHFGFFSIIFLAVATGFTGTLLLLLVLSKCMEYLKSISDQPQSLWLRGLAWVTCSLAYAVFFLFALSTSLACIIGLVFGVVPSASKYNTFVFRDSMPAYFWITLAIWALFSGAFWYSTAKLKVKPAYPWFPKNDLEKSGR